MKINSRNNLKVFYVSIVKISYEIQKYFIKIVIILHKFEINVFEGFF